VRRDLEGLLAYLQEAGLAFTVNPVRSEGTDKRTIITWQGYSMAGAPLFTHGEHATVRDYLTWVETGAFCALLFDGSLLQVTYAVHSGDIVSHRLAYIPSPLPVADGVVESGELLGYLTESPFEATDVYLRTPVRFDFDPGAASPQHPPSHLTINGVDCRVPCRTWLPLSAFVRFVFQHFYPSQWAIHDVLRDLSTATSGSSRAPLGADFAEQIHLSWG